MCTHTHTESTLVLHATVATAMMADLTKALRATPDPFVVPILDDNAAAEGALPEAGDVEQRDLEDRGLSYALYT